LLDAIRNDRVSNKSFSTPTELGRLIESDLALMLSELFEMAQVAGSPSQAGEVGEVRLNNLPA